ncbi:MAG: hypothetical protein AAB425_04990, partial [Bdellovibrionota bacterium]
MQKSHVLTCALIASTLVFGNPLGNKAFAEDTSGGVPGVDCPDLAKTLKEFVQAGGVANRLLDVKFEKGTGIPAKDDSKYPTNEALHEVSPEYRVDVLQRLIKSENRDDSAADLENGTVVQTNCKRIVFAQGTKGESALIIVKATADSMTLVDDFNTAQYAPYLEMMKSTWDDFYPGGWKQYEIDNYAGKINLTNLRIS